MVTEKLIEDTARAYLAAEPEPGIEQDYRELAAYNRRRFEDIPVTVEFVENDPYQSAREMFEDIEQNRRLYIFSGGTHPEHMTAEDNMKGRAVHDYFGHYGSRVNFAPAGEYLKWRDQSRELNAHLTDLLFSEVVGQTALVSHLKEGFNDTRYEQRPVKLPESIKERWRALDLQTLYKEGKTDLQ